MLVRQRQEVQALSRSLSASLTPPVQPPAELAGERILDWEGCLNARDTGGLTTGDGRRIRRGALVRSDVLTRITASGRRALIEHGVRTIVDIRTPSEVARDWDVYPFGHAERNEIDAVAYVNASFTAGHDEHAWDMVKAQYAQAATRTDLNRLDIDHHGAGMAAIAASVADARPGGVLIHCHAGKDRTGLTVAVLLSAIGVDDEQVAADYQLSLLNLEGLITDWLDEMSDDPSERARLRALSEPRAEAMLDTLAYVRERYGAADRYLGLHGLSADRLAGLRERLIERQARDAVRRAADG